MTSILLEGPHGLDPGTLALLDAAPFLVRVSGRDGGGTYFNRSWLEFRGRAVEEEIGDGWLGGIHEEDRERFRAVYRSALSGRRPFRMEYRLRRADGAWRWIVDTGAPRIAPDGTFLGHVGTCFDIDDQRAAEQALSRLSGSHSLILAAAGEGILGLDMSGRHTFVNPAAERLLGWEAEALIGVESHPTWHHSRPDGARYEGEACPILRSLHDGEVHRVDSEVFWRRDGSSFLVEYVSTPIREGGRVTGAVVVFRDITQMARLEAVAASVEVTNSVGWILSAVRHELGNPVNSIKTALGVLAGNLDRFPPEKVRSYIERSLGELGRVEELLSSLKGYNLFERVRVAPVALSEFVTSFAAVAREDFFQRGIRLEVDVPHAPVHALADPRALRQVLLNLLANSGEALDGCLAPRIVLRVSRQGDGVFLRVEDNGCGMPPDVKEHLFQPFRTTKTGGTGLGLVITKKTLARMEAGIQVESEVGRGTTVTLRFRPAEV